MLATTGATTTATGSFNPMCNDFKIGEGEWTDTSIVANEVAVRFKLVPAGVGPLRFFLALHPRLLASGKTLGLPTANIKK